MKKNIITNILTQKELSLVEEKYLNITFINYIRLKHHVCRYKKVISMLNEGNILDIGCGKPSEFMKDCSFLIYLNREESFGIDIKNIEEKKYNFISTSVYQMPFNNESFDNIVMMEVIEHLDKPEKALLEIKRVLKENGKLIITTPDNNFLWKIIWKVWTNTYGKFWNDTHLSNYSIKEWKKLISNHFKIKRIIKNWNFDIIFECGKK